MYKAAFSERALPALRRGDVLQFCFWVMDEHFVPHLLFASFPYVIIACFAHTAPLFPPLAAFLLTWCYCAIFWALLAKLKWFMSLGEGERYFKYAMPTLLILTSLALPAGWLWVLAAYCVFMSVMNLFRAFEFLSRLEKSVRDAKEAVLKLNDYPNGKVLALGYIDYQVLLWGNKPVIGHSPHEEGQYMSEEDYKLFYDRYPLPAPDFRKLKESFQPSYLIGENWALEEYMSSALEPDYMRESLESIYSGQAVELFRVKA